MHDAPTHQEAQYVIYKKDDTQLLLEIAAPGYLAEDISVKVQKNGVAVSGKPRKEAGKGAFAPGFTNFFDIENEKQYDFSNSDNLVKLENGVLSVILPIAKEFQAVTLAVK